VEGKREYVMVDPETERIGGGKRNKIGVLIEGKITGTRKGDKLTEIRRTHHALLEQVL